MLLQSIQVRNLLSYGPDSEPVDLLPLNVLVGPNGSGKSNLLDALSLLRAAPRDLANAIGQRGSLTDWIWKGREHGRSATLTAYVRADQAMPLRYSLQFRDEGQRLTIQDERIENADPFAGHSEPYFYYRWQQGHPVLNVGGKERTLRREQVDPGSSILAQRRDPEQYPELTRLSDAFAGIRVYREWVFGRDAPARQPQRADLRNDFLEEDCSNLALVLSRLRRDPDSKQRLVAGLRELYDGIDDFEVTVEGGHAQVFFQEGTFSVPAVRLSDGTLRYLCLLAILCHPTPAPLICIEEPELGLHPDVLPTVAKLLVDASTRTQLVVTTHSDILIDALSETPRCVLICEKVEHATTVRRLDESTLREWLQHYRLGTLWTMGKLGGNRW